MRKLVSVLLIMALSAAAFAQEIKLGEEAKLKLSGEAKTGIYWQQVQQAGKPVEVDPNALRLESHDGDPNGNRFRLNIEYENGKGFGMKGRIDWERWSNTDSADNQPQWKYAFAYGNFLEDKILPITVAVGKLGGSPWGTGGPEKWKELEQSTQSGGMRVEFKPAIPEQYGKINTGFVLNWLNSYNEAQSRTASFADLLRESVLGFSYTHDLFMIRFAYRLDSDLDWRDRSTAFQYGAEGDDFIYRIEEYALRNLVPGLEAWALGVYEGVFAADPMFYKFENWVFFQYAPDLFTAQVRVGYDYIESRSEFHIKPSFYWNFFNKLISVGSMFSYRQDFGSKIWDGSPYQQMEVEPKIQLNFSSSYIAFVYNWKQEYIDGNYDERGDREPIKRTQFINLRFCIYY